MLVIGALRALRRGAGATLHRESLYFVVAPSPPDSALVSLSFGGGVLRRQLITTAGLLCGKGGEPVRDETRWPPKRTDQRGHPTPHL
jgi:hypothetical protein